MPSGAALRGVIGGFCPLIRRGKRRICNPDKIGPY
jgi:hypothetical protein